MHPCTSISACACACVCMLVDMLAFYLYIANESTYVHNIECGTWSISSNPFIHDLPAFGKVDVMRYLCSSMHLL